MPRLVAAPDKFRGTATASEIASAIARAATGLGWTAVCVPLSDGGEGLLEAFDTPSSRLETTVVTGPDGTKVRASWRLDGPLAVVEMARASGLMLVGGAARNDPVAATTRGTGELLVVAARAVGPDGTVVVGLGGSATTDGGRGAIDAVEEAGGLDGAMLVGACDVGVRFVEAAPRFGPQKGATPGQVTLLVDRLERLAGEYRETYGIDVNDLEGAGAAGGLGGAIAVLGGRLRSGYGLVAELTGLRAALGDADLVVTGEGSLDAMSFAGKVVGGVVGDAQKAGVESLVIAGRVGPDGPVEIERRHLRGLAGRAVRRAPGHGGDARVRRRGGPRRTGPWWPAVSEAPPLSSALVSPQLSRRMTASTSVRRGVHGSWAPAPRLTGSTIDQLAGPRASRSVLSGSSRNHCCRHARTEECVVTIEAGTARGTVTDGTTFAQLSREVREQGLFTRRGRYYAVKIPATVGALGFLFGVVVILGDSWWNLVVAVGIAFVLVQIGFLGHDAGHRQVWSRRNANDAVGLALANLLSGFSFGWWLSKHSRHHAHTNLEGRDPDIVAGALVYTPAQVDARGWFGRKFARVQGLMVLPLLFLEALHLHVAGVRALARRRDPAAILEAVLLVMHAGIFFVAPFFVLAPIRAVAFIVVSQSLFGFYLGVSFLTNHVGMPTLTGDDELGYLRRQVVTSRNLSGPSFTGFIFGGLDSQIEHHLFPTMPRANLRRARATVGPFCAEHGIPYTEQSPWHAYREIVRHLTAVGNARVATVID